MKSCHFDAVIKLKKNTKSSAANLIYMSCHKLKALKIITEIAISFLGSILTFSYSDTFVVVVDVFLASWYAHFM